MDTIRLGIATTTFFSEECSSGITNTVRLLSKEFSRLGIDVSIYVPMHKSLIKRNGRYADLPEKEEIDGFTVHRIAPSISEYKFSPPLLRELIKEDFDLIHTFHYGYFPATAGFVAAKLKKIPHIHTTSYHPSQMNIFKSLLMSLYNITQGKSILTKSNAVFPQNKNEENELKKIADFKSEIVPCPVNNDVFYPKKKSRNLTVAYIGTLLPWKGAGIAFNICKQIEQERKNVDFVFIGSGYMEKELKRRAGKRFTFLKNISNQELAKYYNLADVILYPTKYESFGRVLAEAMSCSTPIISTKVGALPETVGPGGILVDYGDWEKMKNQTLQLLDNAKKRKSLGKKALKHARQYRYEPVARKVFNIYKKILN